MRHEQSDWRLITGERGHKITHSYDNYERGKTGGMLSYA